MLVQQKEQPNKIQQESVCLAPSKERYNIVVMTPWYSKVFTLCEQVPCVSKLQLN
jgi:hypothetical protein